MFKEAVWMILCATLCTFLRLCVFVLSGIWHGAAWTFVFWGFAHGLLHIVEKVLKKNVKTLEPQTKVGRWSVDLFNMAKTFILVTLFWVMFRSSDFAQMKEMFVAMFSNFDVERQVVVDWQNFLYLGLFVLSDIVLRNTRFDRWCDGKPLVLRWFIYAVLIFMIVACSRVENIPFIYFQF